MEKDWIDLYKEFPLEIGFEFYYFNTYHTGILKCIITEKTDLKFKYNVPSLTMTSNYWNFHIPAFFSLHYKKDVFFNYDEAVFAYNKLIDCEIEKIEIKAQKSLDRKIQKLNERKYV